MSQEKNIVFSGLKSFEWLFCSRDVHAPESKDFNDRLSKFEKSFGGSIVNAGTLIAFSYLVLVWLSENNLLENTQEVDYKDRFHCDLDEKKSFADFKHFIRRIRNAISHGNIHIKEKYFIFIDGVPKKDIDFKVTIKINDFGSFLNDILKTWNDYEKLTEKLL